MTSDSYHAAVRQRYCTLANGAGKGQRSGFGRQSGSQDRSAKYRWQPVRSGSRQSMDGWPASLVFPVFRCCHLLPFHAVVPKGWQGGEGRSRNKQGVKVCMKGTERVSSDQRVNYQELLQGTIRTFSSFLCRIALHFHCSLKPTLASFIGLSPCEQALPCRSCPDATPGQTCFFSLWTSAHCRSLHSQSQTAHTAWTLHQSL